MSRVNDTGKFSALPGSTDIPLYSRVKQTAAGVDLAGANDRTFGSALRAGYGPDATRDSFQEQMSVKLANAPGTHFAIANAAITAGAEFQGAASGEIAPLAGGKAIGKAIEAATADGDVIEVVYYPESTTGLDTLADPGDGEAITPLVSSYVQLVTAGAETRTLSDPVSAGQLLTITMLTDGGDGVVTAASAVNQTGNNTLTFGAILDTITLVGIADGASSYRWSVVGNDGVALTTV